MSLIESLVARPNPELALFGQFVGDWDMDIEFYDEDGETRDPNAAGRDYSRHLAALGLRYRFH